MTTAGRPAWLRRAARALPPRRLRARLAARRLPLDRADLGGTRATLADVYHCYGLLLRRNPDPTGYRAYADKVADGITVEQLVGYFRGSPEWLATLARTRPVVFAEFNPGTLRSFSEIEPIEYLRLFTGLGYRMTVLFRRGEPVACGPEAGVC